MFVPYLIFAVFALVSFLIQQQLKSKFRSGENIFTEGGLTGKDIAELMLKQNGISDVKVVVGSGFLTDHYNPMTKTVSLSEKVYNNAHISAAAIAAHECGHAIQHAKAYSWLILRSSLVPVISFVSMWVEWVLLAGILLLTVFPQILLLGIILFAGITIFSLITLPVEIDASRRAINWLSSSNVTRNEQQKSAAVSLLQSAAYTYVVAALGAMAQLVYYIMLYSRRN